MIVSVCSPLLTLSPGFGRTLLDETFPRLSLRLRGTWPCSYVQWSSKTILSPYKNLFERGAEESAQCSKAALCSTGARAIRLHVWLQWLRETGGACVSALVMLPHSAAGASWHGRLMR